MKSFTGKILIVWWTTFLFCTCQTTDKKGSSTTQESVQDTVAAEAAMPDITISVKALADKKLPSLQSFVWGRQGSKIVCLGGRVEGFHGLTGRDQAFKASRANTFVYVIDFSNFSFKMLGMDMNDSQMLQFSSTNMEFAQSGNNLFVVGGFGLSSQNVTRSNTTFNRIVSFSISELIKQVELGPQVGDVKKAIQGMASSPFLQVTGGELVIRDNNFYLMFGQKFGRMYDPGSSGTYTCAVRRFRFSNNAISDTSSLRNCDALHRRDLPVAHVLQNNLDFYAAFGGVFTENNDGYTNPAYVTIKNGAPVARIDTLIQKTNQYDCAIVPVFDPITNTHVSALMGGIGKYQYHTDTHAWEDGDSGAKLPFVKTITQMICANGVMSQKVQLPPQQPELPELVGANAIFIPRAELLYDAETISYRKLKPGRNLIGYMFGGIKSIKPTSSEIFPTSLNKTVYEVYLDRP